MKVARGAPEIAALAAPKAGRNDASEIAPAALWSAFIRPIRSRILSRSASAKAAAIVRNSFDRPLLDVAVQVKQLKGHPRLLSVEAAIRGLVSLTPPHYSGLPRNTSTRASTTADATKVA